MIFYAKRPNLNSQRHGSEHGHLRKAAMNLNIIKYFTNKGKREEWNFLLTVLPGRYAVQAGSTARLDSDAGLTGILEVQAPVGIGDDKKIKEVQSRVEDQEIIQCAAGTFPAWKVNTASLMGGLFKEGGQFNIWISADARKLPVQFEARMHLGRAFGKLKAVQ